MYVLDANVRAHGGGVYRVPIACNGTLGRGALVVPASGATAMALLPLDGTRAVLAAMAAGTSAAKEDVHLLDLVRGVRLGSVSAFGDGEAIVSSVIVAPDGQYALVADNGISVGSRLAAVRISAATLQAVPALLATPFPDGIAVSPYDNAALVLNDDTSDSIQVLAYSPANASAPWVITGQVKYKFGRPLIPTTVSTIVRGGLKGTVFVAEDVACRQLRFGPNGVSGTAGQPCRGAVPWCRARAVGLAPSCCLAPAAAPR